MSLELFYSLCPPAKFYFVIGISGLINNKNNPSSYSGLIIYFTIQLFFIFIWTYFLQLLCRKGYFKVAWFLVLFPVVFLFLFLFLIILMVLFSSSKKKEKEMVEQIKHPDKGEPNTSSIGGPLHTRGKVGLDMSDVIIDV